MMQTTQQIRWDRNTRELILTVRDKLEEEGWHRPTIRTILYRLLALPPGDWTKKHYDTLCRRLGKWRDEGLIPWGLFSDGGGGSFYRPMLPEEIVERIQALKGAVPASLMPDGYLHTVFVEHEDMVSNFTRWLDYRIPVVSSKGQIRRENLYAAASGWVHVAEELGAKGVKCIAIVDWDEHGKFILQSHEKWLRRQFKIRLEKFGITADHVRAARLPVHEDHQLDGVIAAYGPPRFREELRAAVGL